MIFESLKRKLGLRKDSKPFVGFFFIQKLFLCHPGYGEEFKSTQLIKYLAFYLVLGLPCYMAMLGHLIMATSGDILAERLESLTYTIQTIVQYAVVLTYIKLGNKFMSLFDRLFSEKFGKPEGLPQAFYRFNMIVSISYFFTCGIIFSVGIHNYFCNWYCDGRQLLNDKRFVCGLMLPAWYPFEVDSVAFQNILYLWFTFFCMLVVPHSALTISGLMCIPWFAIIKLEHLKKQLDEIDDVAMFQRKFRYFLDYYSEIYGCVKHINNTWGYCLSCQFALVTMMIALLEYNIIMSRNPIEFVTLMVWFFFEALADIIGQALEDKHEELLYSVYSLPWYDMAPELKKKYCLFFGKVQLPVNLKAQPIVYVNKQFLLSVLHGTYSMLMFLLNTTK